MTTNRLVLCALLALTLLGTGCSGVYLARPIGDKPLALKATDWNGTWISHEGAAQAQVTDAAGGRLQLAEAKFQDGVAKLELTTLVIRESGGWLFATLLDDDHPNRLSWARLKRERDELVVWLPQKDAFRALVQSGKLSGRMDGDDVLLAPPTDKEMNALISGALGVPFIWDSPIVLRRLAP